MGTSLTVGALEHLAELEHVNWNNVFFMEIFERKESLV